MLDDLSAEAKPHFVVCHANSPGILPVQWCMKNGVGLERPRAYEGQDFDWADYLKQSGTEAAPDACFPDVSMGWRDVNWDTPDGSAYVLMGALLVQRKLLFSRVPANILKLNWRPKQHNTSG